MRFVFRMVPRSTATNDPPSRPRLQKVLATSGFGSRRQCETLILEGRVEIDRQVVTELGTRVDPHLQQIRVDGVTVKPPRLKCFVLHKPEGVISTARDPWARTRVIDLVDDPDRLFTVGRLDKSSSGLILVTNDGDLAHRLTHPRFGVEKVYRVVVAGKPSLEALQQLRRGVHLAEGRARVDRVTLKKAHAKQSVLEIVLTEGRNREIRRLLARVGHKVQQLKRIAVGDLTLGNLLPGQSRRLTWEQIETLRRAAIAAVGHHPTPRPERGRPRGPRANTRTASRSPGRPRTRGATKPAARPSGPKRPRRPGKASTWRKAHRKTSGD